MRNNKGFTLIEIIISIVLASILGAFSIGFLTNIMQATQLTASQKDLVDEAKLAMEFLIRELRVADETANPVGCGTDPNCLPGTIYNKVTFDKLPGYTQDTNLTGIVYAFDTLTGTLKRTTSGGTVTTVLATKVTAFSITESTTIPNFYTVTITLQGSQGEKFFLESAVRPRSLI